MPEFFNRVRTKLRLMLRASRIRSLGGELRGSGAWDAMDRLGIPGYGTELLRLDFLPDVGHVPAWEAPDPVHARLAGILDRDAGLQAACLERCLGYADALAAWPVDAPDRSFLPWIRNEFLSQADMLALYGMIRDLKPVRYLEIGCGVSTRVAVAAVADGALRTEIVCVDPSPRAALPPNGVRHLAARLELAVEEVLRLAVPGTVLFFDGSHRSFPGSDVTVFFLALIPALPPGVVVHIHDIFLPGDYPRDAAPRYWSEQYLLAAWLLGGASGIEVLLPGAHLEAQPAKWAGIAPHLRAEPGPVTRFSSFWFRKT